MAFAATIDLASLDGTNGGVIINGLDFESFGWSIAAVGDVNGDGHADFIVGARQWTIDRNNTSGEGAVYVVFGGASGFPANFSLNDLNGHNGFVLHGEKALGQLGWDVAGIGDINNDGFADLLASAYLTDNFSGTAFVIYGRDAAVSGDYAAAYTVSDIGVSLPGSTINSTGRIVLGSSLTGIGDINHDGYADFAVAAQALGGDIGDGNSTGGAYVIYGGPGALPATIAESDLDGVLGFKLYGSQVGDYAGSSISSAGDINGDGIDDLIIGASSADGSGGHASGSAFVLFGRDAASQGPFAASVQLSDLDGANGFRIDGATPYDVLGKAVASIGDINGDGFDDLAIAAQDGGDSFDGMGKGAVYILFGRDTSISGAFSAVMSTADLMGGLGFRIEGLAPGDYIGQSVAGLGDINGDGVDDFIIGAPSVSVPGGFYEGAAYVVFGSRSGFAGGINLAALDGSNGFVLKGSLIASETGHDVYAAGDLNGDGVGDIMVASPNGGPTGSGRVYIVYGQGAGPVSLIGDAGDNTLNGGAGADTLSGLAGKDILNGLGGDDILDGGDDNDQLFGGDGSDILSGGEGNDILYGGNGADDLDGGNGADKLYGGSGDDIIYGSGGADRIEGGADNDYINGGSGNDYIDGGTGADTMIGGDGNDIFYVDNIGDTTLELANEGYDIVRAELTWVLSANIECLQLQGVGDFDGTGNELANNLQGNVGSNHLYGLAGVDTINGNDGDDFIIGGTGNDLLRGGAGADTFVVLQESVGNGVLEIDTIYDFSTAEGDRIDLSAIDADSLTAGDQAFHLVASFGRHAGEMTLTLSGAQTLLKLDVNGDGVADYQMKINGNVTGDSGGWAL